MHVFGMRVVPELCACRNWIKFWDIDFTEGIPGINGKNGIIGKRGKVQRLYCVHFIDKDNIVTGLGAGQPCD